MRSIGIIPARYASTRFPGKPLVNVNGKPMIQRVYEQALKADVLEQVVVATDDRRIADAVLAFGGQVQMTSEAHPSGTDRCLEALEGMGQDFDVVVNIQGDEPYVSPAQIELILSCFEHEKTEIATLIKRIDGPEELFDPNRPKVLIDSEAFALYFSRQALPYIRNQAKEQWHTASPFYKHIGMYAYRSQTLKEIAALQPSNLEKAEGLEQLRWLENGYRIRTAITKVESHSIDSPEDLQRVEKHFGQAQ